MIWNHLLRYRGEGVARLVRQAAPTRGGDYTMVEFADEFYMLYSMDGMTEEELDNKILFFKQEVLAPARLAGGILLVHETLDQVKEHRSAWLYNPGQRRVRRAPNVAYDNPGTAADGMRTSDQLDMFNGAADKYDWKLVGKQEIYVPYNSYKLHGPDLKYKDILKPLHINQEHPRYELHRVWVVDATLKEGERHIYKRRTFYVDEDSWQILVVDSYDNRDQLWRVSEGHSINYYDVPCFWTTLEVHTDLQAGRYLALGLDNENCSTSSTSSAPLEDYTPGGAAARGRALSRSDGSVAAGPKPSGRDFASDGRRMPQWTPIENRRSLGVTRQGATMLVGVLCLALSPWTALSVCGPDRAAARTRRRQSRRRSRRARCCSTPQRSTDAWSRSASAATSSCSDDAARSWTPGRRCRPSQPSPAVHFHDRNLGWAVGHDAVILRTRDGGATWELVHQDPEQERPFLDVCFADADHGFAIGAYGLFARDPRRRGNLGGAHDQRRGRPTSITCRARTRESCTSRPRRARSIAPTTAARPGSSSPLPTRGRSLSRCRSTATPSCWLGLRGHLFRSDDAGESWQAIETGTEAMLTGRHPPAATGARSWSAWAAMVLVSEDGGRSFAVAPAARPLRHLVGGRDRRRAAARRRRAAVGAAADQRADRRRARQL